MAHRTVPPYGWMALLFLLIFIIGIVVWAFLGTIHVKINGRGIVLSPAGLFTVQSQTKGVVQQIYVMPGDFVQKGTLIAEIFDANKMMQLQTAMIRQEALEKEVERLTHQVELEKEASEQSLRQQLDSLQFNIKIANERLDFLNHELKKRQDLYKEGLIILNLVQDIERQISDIKVQIEENRGKIASILSELNKSYRTEELKNREMELLKAEQEVEITKKGLEYSKVYSPFEGMVLEVLVNLGEVIEEGKGLVNLEFQSPNQPHLFYCYFPSDRGKRIQVGNQITMYLTTINREEFGGILSTVQSVSQYAVSEQALTSQIHNANLTHFLTNKQPVIQVIATPLIDPQDPSGYAWTSGRGPPIALTTGLIGFVEATIEKVRPIYYLLPFQEFKENVLEEKEE